MELSTIITIMFAACVLGATAALGYLWYNKLFATKTHISKGLSNILMAIYTPFFLFAIAIGAYGFYLMTV